MPARGDLAIPNEIDCGSHRSLKGQIFWPLRHLPLGWRLKPGYGCPSQPGACRSTQYLTEHPVARSRPSDRGGLSPSLQDDRRTFVSLELFNTCLAARDALSSPYLLRASLPLRPRASVYRVGLGSGEQGQSPIVLPPQTKKMALVELT